MNDQTDHTSMLTGSEVLSLASVRGIYSEVSAHVKEKSKVVPTTSVAETLSEIQGLFNESQKIAYVGLCYTLIYNYKRSRFTSKNADKRALVQYEKWSLEYMEKIFVYLEFTTKERNLIQNLAFHGAQPKDLASSLIKDAKDVLKAVEKDEKARLKKHQESLDAEVIVPDDALYIAERPRDIRFVTLSHMFLLSISDGYYDARSRALVKSVALHLQISMMDTIRVEFAIADQLRISVHEDENLKHAEVVVGERNKIESKKRYLYTGLAAIGGAAVIGLTAGIAAPFIGAGIGATLTTFGYAGAAGVSSFMVSTGGLALITTGGVLTGGGMSGVKMMKRTRDVQQFEFLSIADAMALILKHREERRSEKLKKSKQGKSSPKTQSDEKRRSINELDRRSTEILKDEKGVGYINPIEYNTDLWVKSMTELRSNSMRSIDMSGIGSAPYSEAGDDTPIVSVASTIITGSMVVEEPNSDITSHSFVHENPLAQDSASRQTNVLITVAGWVYHNDDEHSLPFSILERNIHGDQYTLIWETDTLIELGTSLKIVVSEIAQFIVQQGIQALLLPALMAALTGPMWMLKLSYLIDNPFGNGLTKADKVGRVLADTLIGQVQGNRPVSLVGYSLGARVIYYCLEELAAKGAFGIVEDVYLFGCPVLTEIKGWQNVATVVSGRIVNGYCPNDSILAILYRASASSWSDVAGLQPILGVEGVENVNLEEIIKGHNEYYLKLPLALQKCGFSITDIFFEDEEDMEEQDRIQAQERKQKISEQKLREKEEKLRKKQQRYQEKFLQANEESERQLAQRLKEEALRLVEQDDLGDFNVINGASLSTVNQSGASTPDRSSINVLFEPRELKSTMPPLQIPATVHNRGQSVDLDSNLSEAGLQSLVENLDIIGSNKVPNGLGINTEQGGSRRTEFEYISDPEEESNPGENPHEYKLRRESSKSELFLKSANSSPITEPSPSYSRGRYRSSTPHSPDLIRKLN